MSEYRLISESSVDLDVEAAFEWYEREQAGLGVGFLDELRATYSRIADSPFKYQELRGSIRHALLRRFPYIVYFAVDGDIIIVVAVLHASREPAEWQRRRG